MSRKFTASILALVTALAMLLSTTAWAGFADVPADGELGEAVEWALDAGVALGTGDGQFEPDALCTRAAFVTFLWRLNGAPDMGEDTAWWSDAAAWAVEQGLLDSADGMEEPVSGDEFAAVMAKLGGKADGGAQTVTRGAAIIGIYVLATAEPTLDDGTPWVNYALRENLAAVTAQTLSPKDDFYLYTNYDWMKDAELPAGRSVTSPIYSIADEITAMGKAVLTDKTLTSDDAKLVQHLYDAYLDWDARNALGVKPVQEIVDKIKAVSTLDELTALFCDPDSGAASLVDFGSAQGRNDSETYLLWVIPMGLFLGDSAEYAQRTELGRRYEAAKAAAAGRMLPKFGYTAGESAQMFARALALEAELAPSIMTSAEEMSPDYVRRTNNEMDRAGAEALCAAFPLLKILDGKGYAAAQRYLVTQPDYLRKLDTLYTPERLDDLKNYLIVCAALNHLTSLDRDSYEIKLEMSAAINGATGSRPDEDVAFDTVRSLLTTPMDRAFLEKYDAAKMKADITRVCEEAVDYYRTMLQSEDWLSEETRQKAIEKLDAITINAVYPDKWRDYGGLDLTGLGYYDCVEAIGRFEKAYDASLINEKVDHELWGVDILSTNAYYNQQDNSITIIRGLLGGVMYREDMSDAELYAAVGNVIGHEISHAFDTNGAQFDAQGNMNNWWTEADYAAFTARADKLAAYYDRMVAFGGYPVQGQNIISEAIADMAGMKCMLGLLEQQDDPDYRAFFESFARLWGRIATEEYEYFLLTQDVHPLNYLRANATLQQFEQFYKTYDIRPGDGMYLAPADRVLVW